MLGISAGIVVLIWPGFTAVVLLLVVAARSLVLGVFQIVAAIQLRREIANEWFLALGGAISVLFGSYVFANPGRGPLRSCG